MDVTSPLTRDGGEQPTYEDGRRPMTGDEIVTFARRVQPILNDNSKVDVAADEHGGLTVTLWPDDTDGDGSQIISFRPVTAVKS